MCRLFFKKENKFLKKRIQKFILIQIEIFDVYCEEKFNKQSVLIKKSPLDMRPQNGGHSGKLAVRSRKTVGWAMPVDDAKAAG